MGWERILDSDSQQCFCHHYERTTDFWGATEEAMKRILVIAIGLSVAAAFSAANAAADPTNAPWTTDTSPPPATVKSPLPATGSTNEPTIITAEQLHGDSMHNVGTVEGDGMA